MLDREHILTLLNCPKIGRNTIRLILDNISETPTSLNELLDMLVSLQIPRLVTPSREILQQANSKALFVIERSQKIGIEVHGFNDKEFPDRFRHIPDSPVVLFVKGNKAALNIKKTVAIVGTREPSPYGELIGRRLGEVFAEQDFVVVSGLALGCDTLAHTGCLQSGGQTVAVMAHGLDTIYPAINKKLAQTILEKSGCLISEYPTGLRARGNMFVERDRLQAGLSAGIIVVETDIKGGTLHTVQFCLDQKKPLAAIQHPDKFLNVPKARGNQMLIKEKNAYPLSNQNSIDEFTELLLNTVVTLPSKKILLKKKEVDVIQQSLDFE